MLCPSIAPPASPPLRSLPVTPLVFPHHRRLSHIAPHSATRLRFRCPHRRSPPTRSLPPRAWQVQLCALDGPLRKNVYSEGRTAFDEMLTGTEKETGEDYTTVRDDVKVCWRACVFVFVCVCVCLSVCVCLGRVGVYEC